MDAVPGRFNDGRSAASRRVTVRAGAGGLDIRGEDGLMVAFWHTQDLRADGDLPDGQGLRLRCATDPDARLMVERAETIRALLPARRRFAYGKAAATVAGTLAMVLALWLGIPAASRTLVNVVPVAWEQRWGQSLADEMEKQWGSCRQPAGEAALRLLGDRLAAGLTPEARPRRLVVVRHKDQNAFALPGGTVLVFSGLLTKAEQPGELAGVLAHEYTHLRLRHPTAAMIRAMGVGAAVTLVTGDSSGVVATGAAMAMAGAYSRDDEAEADRGAVELLGRAGLDGAGLAAFFRRLADQPNQVPEWLSTHPDSLARARAVEAMGGGTAPGTAALSPEQWAAVKVICGE